MATIGFSTSALSAIIVYSRHTGLPDLARFWLAGVAVWSGSSSTGQGEAK